MCENSSVKYRMSNNLRNVDPKELENLKTAVVRAASEMFEYGLIKSTFGVVSARIPQTEYVIITPSGFSKARLATENLCIVDLGAKVIEGKLRPSSETSMHVFIHKRLPEANAVIHTHSPVATAFAAANKEIPCVTTEQGFAFGGRVPIVTEYFCPGSRDSEKLESVVNAFRKAKAVLLKNHGVMIIGNNIEEALDNAVVVEDVATTALYAYIIGGEVKELSADEIKEIREFRLRRYGQTADELVHMGGIGH